MSFSIFESEPVMASNLFQLQGEVFEINQKRINVGDRVFPVIATVKIIIKGKKNPRLQDIKVGDFVAVEIVKYNGKLYVDKIFLIDPPRQ